MRPSLSIHIQLPSNLGHIGCVETTGLSLPRSVNCPMTIFAVFGLTHTKTELAAGYTPHSPSSRQNGDGNCPGGNRLRNPARRRIRYSRSRWTYSMLYSPLY